MPYYLYETRIDSNMELMPQEDQSKHAKSVIIQKEVTTERGTPSIQKLHNTEVKSPNLIDIN